MLGEMKKLIDDLLGEDTIIELAFAIAFGWSLFEVARGTAAFIEGLTTNLGTETGFTEGGMSWDVAHHIVDVDALVVGLIELAVVAAIWVFVSRRRATL